MPMEELTFLGNPTSTWVVAAAVAAGVTVLLVLARRVVVGLLRRTAARTGHQVDDLALALVRRTRGFFILAVGVYAGGLSLTLSPRTTQALHTLIILAVLGQAAVWGSTLISFLASRYVQKQVGEDPATATTAAALGLLGRLVLWSVILLLALDNLGVDVTALIAGLGVGGIAVALALQNILGDLFASFSIVLDKPFVIGDFIIVGDFLGTVEHVGLKTTRLRSLSGEQVIFANGDLLQSRVRNYKRMYERRVVFSLGVTYETPHAKLREIPGIVRDIITAQEQTRFDRAHFKAYGDFSLVFEGVYYVSSPDYTTYMDIQQAINLEIYRRFKERGIDFAYPTQLLYVNMGAGAAPALAPGSAAPAG